MVRDIMTGVPAQPDTETGTAAVPAAQPSTPAQLPASKRDALAEAFPEWDLLPAVPFVRRVK